MALDFLKRISAEQNVAYKMNAAKVERIKESVQDGTRMMELCLKDCDNMLAARITIQNLGFPFSDEFGVNENFLNAFLEAMTGNLEELKAFDVADQYAEKGTGFKLELLEAFLAVKDLQPTVRTINLAKDDTQLVEVVFQLGYLRKVKFYFQAKDDKAINKLRMAGLEVA